MKKRNLNVIKKTARENSMDLIHMESQKMNATAFQGTGRHKNKKYDKKTRRVEGKKICNNY